MECSSRELVGSEDDLKHFNSLAETKRSLTPPLRGIMAETATTGLVRYPWPLQRSLYAHALCEVLTDYEAEASVEVGPPALLPGGESGEGARRRLRGDLEAFAHEAPFTLQRLAEVLLEPRKQYARLDKLRPTKAQLKPQQVLALEKLLLVTSTVPHTAAPPPRPPLASLPPVNEAVTPPQRAPGSAGSRIPDTPADGSHEHSPRPDGAGAALGNGAVAERGGLGLGIGFGFGITGAALAASPPAAAHGSEMPNGALQGAAPGAAADGPTAMQAMTTDPLAGQPMAQPHVGVLLPVADIGPDPNPPSPVPPALPVPALANPAAAALDSPVVPIRGSGSAGGAHPAPDRLEAGDAADSAPGAGGAAPAKAARGAARAGATDAPSERADAAEGSARLAASAAAASGAVVGGRGLVADSREARLEPAEQAAQAAGLPVSPVAAPMAVGTSPGGQTGGGGVQVGSEHQRAGAAAGAGLQGSAPGAGKAAAGTPADPSPGSLPSPGSRGASERNGGD